MFKSGSIAIALLSATLFTPSAFSSIIVNSSVTCVPVTGQNSGGWQETDQNGEVSSDCDQTSAWGSIDSNTASFKLHSHAVTTANTLYTGSWANAAIYDTIVIESTEDYAQVAVNLFFHFDATMNYSYPASTAVLGSPKASNYSSAALSRVSGGFELSGYDYNAEPDNYEEIWGRYEFRTNYDFDFKAGPFIEINYPASHLLVESINNETTYSHNLPNQLSAGFSITEILTLPTNSQLDLAYYAGMSQICSLMNSCGLLLDGTNTFTLGLTALSGNLVSQNGYGYQNVTAQVPAPATIGLFGLALVLLARVKRR